MGEHLYVLRDNRLDFRWLWSILQWAIPKRAKISGVGGVDAVFGRLDVGYASGYCL